MPTWCHMFNSTLTGSARIWLDDLPLESVDSYDDLKKAFLANFLQQKKCINDPVEIHHIKQREWESTKDFVQTFKSERSGHNTDESMHLKRQIKELIKAGNLSHLIKELKQGSGKDQPKEAKKGEASGNEKALAILMVQPCRLRPEVKIQMVPATAPLIGFSGEIVWPIGQISLSVKIGDTKHSTSTRMNFVAVRSPSPYNEIIGRLGVRKIQAVLSTTHEMLKFPIPRGILTLRSSKLIPLECTMVSGPKVQPFASTRVVEERIKVAIHPEYPEQTIAIGSTLMEDGQKDLCGLLRRNLDIFTWKPADMIGVLRHVAEHWLNVREGCPPVRLKKRSQAPERNKAIQDEVERLIEAGIIKEVH
ncbi:reverse transcriptase domain-containing protein [Tanacetum coccineum]